MVKTQPRQGPVAPPPSLPDKAAFPTKAIEEEASKPLARKFAVHWAEHLTTKIL